MRRLSVNAVDAQLIDQLSWTGEMICASITCPRYMAGIGPPPPYANVEPLLQLYYSQGLQRLLVSAEQVIDAGLEFPRQTLGTEFDIDDLIWMNAETRTKAAHEAIALGRHGAGMKRDARTFSLPPVPGGDSPNVQQQYYSLEALAERDPAIRLPSRRRRRPRRQRRTTSTWRRPWRTGGAALRRRSPEG